MKDVSLTPEQVEQNVAFGDALAQDINQCWPRWIELARISAPNSQMSSPHMLVASTLLAQAVMVMLWLQLPQAKVSAIIECIFEQMCDPENWEHLRSIAEDKKDILGFINKVLADQAQALAQQKAMN